MRVICCTAEEIERGLGTGLFFPNQEFDTESDEENFCRLQHDLVLQLINFLEKKLETKNLDGGFYVNEDVWLSFGMSLEIWAGKITPALLISLMSFLLEHGPEYTISACIFQKITLSGKDYIGRIFISKDILHVEKSVLKNEQVLNALKEFESQVVKKK